VNSRHSTVTDQEITMFPELPQDRAREQQHNVRHRRELAQQRAAQRWRRVAVYAERRATKHRR